jgi:hypothetical protein
MSEIRDEAKGSRLPARRRAMSAAFTLVFAAAIMLRPSAAKANRTLDSLYCAICGGDTICLRALDAAFALAAGAGLLYLAIFRPGAIYELGRRVYNSFVSDPMRAIPKQNMKGRYFGARIVLLLVAALPLSIGFAIIFAGQVSKRLCS